MFSLIVFMYYPKKQNQTDTESGNKLKEKNTLTYDNS